MSKPTEKPLPQQAVQDLKGIKVVLSDFLPSQTMVVSKDLYKTLKGKGND